MTFFGTNTLGMGLILSQLRQWRLWDEKMRYARTRDARIFGKTQRGTSHGGVGLALHIKNVAHASAMPRAGFLLLPHTVWSLAAMASGADFTVTSRFRGSRRAHSQGGGAIQAHMLSRGNVLVELEAVLYSDCRGVLYHHRHQSKTASRMCSFATLLNERWPFRTSCPRAAVRCSQILFNSRPVGLALQIRDSLFTAHE